MVRLKDVKLFQEIQTLIIEANIATHLDLSQWLASTCGKGPLTRSSGELFHSIGSISVFAGTGGNYEAYVRASGIPPGMLSCQCHFAMAYAQICVFR